MILEYNNTNQQNCWNMNYTNESQPCWGEVKVIDYINGCDGFSIWACDGHEQMYTAGFYLNQPT